VGVLYTVLPLTDDIRQWLRESGECDMPEGDGRHPTPAEVRKVISEMPGVIVEYYWAPPPHAHAWQALVFTPIGPDEGPWTLANFSSFESEDEPSELSFEKGWPQLIIEILVRATRHCGPLVLIADTGDAPLVIGPSDTPSVLLDSWGHTQAAD
jgi:hypothetical protein